jgi:hypothetical protein
MWEVDLVLVRARAAFVQADYFAVRYRSIVREQSADSQREILKRGECISVP